MMLLTWILDQQRPRPNRTAGRSLGYQPTLALGRLGVLSFCFACQSATSVLLIVVFVLPFHGDVELYS